MSQLGLQLRPTPSTPSDAEWTELEWDNGRVYRWRLDRVREYEYPLTEYVTRAPSPLRWELEYWATDDQWRAVRNYARRDEIWLGIRDEVVP